MKKYISFFIFSLAWMVSYGQTGTKNYILSRTYKQKGATVNDISKVQIQVNYLDGFGRPVQAVNVGQSNTGTDIVTPMEYDAYGRELKKFLPYSTTGTNGYFQGSGAASQATYYSTNNVPQLQGPASDLGQAFDYTVPDTSPLNRPLGQRGPGTKSAASVITYGSNTAGEVKNYYYTPNANISLTVAVNGNYAAGRLSRTQTTDENGKVSIEFKDLQGRIICTKMVYSTTETLDTYYVYDDFGQLRAVLQPEYQDTPDAGKFAFVYGYDSRGRQIMKKKPGAVVEYMVYDKLDRLVMYNDGVLQIKGWNNLGIWMFIKYDSLSRPIMYGGLSESRNRAQLQTLFDNSNNLSEYKTTTGIGYTMAYTYPLISEGHVHEVVYYDDYTFPKAANLAYNSTAGYYPSYNNTVKSKVTGGRIRILLPNYVVTGWLTNAVYYDDEYRTIQTTRELYDMGASAIERVSTKYKYDLAAVVEQEKTEQLISTTLTNSLLKTYTYDHVDRLLSIKEKVTQGANTKEATTVAHRYNALGQLKHKWLHSTDAVNFRRRITYTDNIRGWQTEAKTQYKQTSGGSDLPFFGYGLDYVNGSNYTNGNISSMQWNGKDESSFTKGMSFIYDDANRLTTSTGLYSYTDLENGLTYSKNGNIKTLTRSGASVDNLSYIYNGNQLTSLTDASGNNSGVKNGVSTYTYDYNGNTLSDGNRGITISYNQRNLPQVIKKGTDSLIYFYDSWGRKHKYIADTITIKYAGPFDYRLVGSANNLNRVSLSEGQAVYRGGALKFEYYLKDQLGNIRVVFDEQGKILQKSDYYPFGLEIDRNNPMQPLATRNAVNRYSFLGKETQVATGYIDLSKRFYDPTIGRFMVVDPVTDTQENQSVYQYSWNNPILRSDPNGDCPVCPAIPYLVPALTEGLAVLTEIVVASGALAVIKEGVMRAGADAGLYSPATGAAMSTTTPGELTGGNNTSKKAQKTYQTYTKPAKDPNKKPYSGKTSGKGTPEENIAKRDKNHHKNDEHGPAELDKSSTNPDAIRGREQQLIDQNGGAQSQGGNSGNAINSVSPNNPKKDVYDKAARDPKNFK